MLNFVLGAVAGGIIACVVTIVAARQPDVQSRLGLVQPAIAAALPAPKPEIRCPAARAAQGQEQAERSDMFFARRRFWDVAPKTN